MALDFPASPSVGQVFTSGNQSWLWDGTKWTALGSVQNVFKPNKFINPFCEIDQRHEGANTTVTSAGITQIIDGFFGNLGSASGCVVTAARGAGGAPPGYSAFLNFVTTTAATAFAASDYSLIGSNIEADDLVDTGLGTANAATLSFAFWAFSTIAGTYYLNLRNTASNRSFIAPFSLPTPNTWQLISLVVPGDTSGTWVISGNGVGLQVGWAAAAGTAFQTSTLNAWQTGNFLGGSGMPGTFMTTLNAGLRIGPVGFWVSPSPQPFLRLSFQYELARCQRYVEKSYDIGVAPGTANAIGGVSILNINGTTAPSGGTSVEFKVSKRTIPSMTTYSYVTGASGHTRDVSNSADVTNVLSYIGMNGYTWAATATNATNLNLGTHFLADASL